MRNDDSELFISIWDTIKNYLILKEKKEAAYFFIKKLDEWDAADLDDLYGQDDLLDYGIQRLSKEKDDELENIDDEEE